MPARQPAQTNRVCRTVGSALAASHLGRLAIYVVCVVGLVACEPTEPGRSEERSADHPGNMTGESVEGMVEHGSSPGEQSDPVHDVLVSAPIQWTIPDVAPPAGMVLIPGGRTTIGSPDGFEIERPMFDADIAPFFMDEHEVTVRQFAEFVEATGYVTQAEEFGNSAVIDERSKQWILLEGATWKMPAGAEGDPAPNDHPVTHVSWNDAVAYASWAGKRLPTEIEWEHAARGAVNNRSRYSPGLAIDEDGFPSANLWQGTFPYRNTGKDGYFRTASVGTFGPNVVGLSDMAGNVWEWVDSWYRPYSERNDPYYPDEFSARVQRGGSFLCNDSWCHGFRVSARGQSTPESSHFHVGFRCVQDIPGVEKRAEDDG